MSLPREFLQESRSTCRWPLANTFILTATFAPEDIACFEKDRVLCHCPTVDEVCYAEEPVNRPLSFDD